jgi:hypothetical protein
MDLKSKSIEVMDWQINEIWIAKQKKRKENNTIQYNTIKYNTKQNAMQNI